MIHRIDGGEPPADRTLLSPAVSDVPLAPGPRRTRLEDVLADEVATRGARIETMLELRAVLVYGSRTNHLLHLLLSVVTAGLWLIVWAILAMAEGERRRMIAVDEFGAVRIQTG